MKKLHFVLAIGLLTTLLAGSLFLNWFLFRQGRWYYVQLSAVRLDPLGLSTYPTSLDRETLTNTHSINVVFFGDSRAANWPAPDVKEFAFINRGVGGETSTQTALRFEYHVKPLNPQFVVIQTGINDLKAIPLLPGQKEDIIENCKANIEQIAAKSREMGAVVIVTTILPIGEVPIERRPFWSADVGLAIDEVNSHLRSLEGEGVYLFDSYAALVGNNGKIKPEYSYDLLHLNDAGYEKLNEEFTKFLTSLP